MNWKMSDIKAKGIFIENGKGRKLVPVKQKKITQAQIQKAIAKAQKKVKRKDEVDPKTYIHHYLMSLGKNVVTEYRFSKRMFRFDWAIPNDLIYIEFDGSFGKTRHGTMTGLARDNEKFNLAVTLGWRGFRYTVLNYKNIIDDIK